MSKKTLAEILAVEKGAEGPLRKIKHPPGWTPGFEMDGDVAQIVSEPTTNEQAPDEAELITSFGLDPDEWDIVGKVNCRRWQANVGGGELKWLFYYKIDVQKRNPEREALFEDLTKRIHQRKPRKLQVSDDGSSYILILADGQLGKSEGGGATETVDRFMDYIDQAEAHVKSLRKIGVPLNECWVLNAGDLLEGCSQNYPNQQFTVELDHRQQNRVAMALLDHAVDRMAGMFERVGVATCPSNHGEQRLNGKAYTNPGDNMDIQIVEQLAFAYSKNPDRYGHVTFVIPDQEVSVAFTTSNTVIALNHGHFARGGGNVENKIIGWWKDQGLTDEDDNPLAVANILVTGHYHHFRVVEVRQNKWWFQAPSFDGGSKWFKDQSGANSSPGLLAFTVADKQWDNLRIFK